MATRLSVRAFSFATYHHLHDYHQLVIPLQGGGDNYTPAGDGRIGAGQCIVFPANVTHKFIPDEQSRFLVADMDELPASLASLSHPVVSIPAAVQAFCHYAEVQLSENTSSQLFEQIGQLLFELLSEQVFQPRIDPRINRVLEHLQRDICAAPSLTELASTACLSLSQLKKLFKATTGTTTSGYLLNLRMAKARALLAHSDSPVSVIANQVGYKDSSTFSNRYSRYFGHSPRQSRQQT